jgi:hypothetical protein
MPESLIAVAPDSTGKNLRTRQRAVGANTIQEQFVIIQDEKVVTHQGRASSYRITGRNPAAAANQVLATIFNASATVLVRVNRVVIDGYSTAARLIAVAPGIFRATRITAAPAGGTAMVKAPRDTLLASDANVTVLGDASADGTNSATALTATLTAGSFLVQEVAPRAISGITTASTAMPWFEPADRILFFNGEPDIILRQTQGLAIFITAPTTNSVPATDFFTITIDWDEYTLP